MLSWIKGVVAGALASVWTLVVVLSFGAMVGIGAYYAGRVLGPLVAALVGVILVTGAYYSGAAKLLTDEHTRDRIEQLEQSNLEKERELAAQEATNAALVESLARSRETVEHNAEVMTHLSAAINELENTEECDVPAEIIEGLDDLR